MSTEKGLLPRHMGLEENELIVCVETKSNGSSFFEVGEEVRVLENGYLDKRHPCVPNQLIHQSNLMTSKFVRVDELLWE